MYSISQLQHNNKTRWNVLKKFIRNWCNWTKRMFVVSVLGSRAKLMPLLLECLHQQLLQKNELKTCADLLGNLLSCLSKTKSVCSEIPLLLLVKFITTKYTKFYPLLLWQKERTTCLGYRSRDLTCVTSKIFGYLIFQIVCDWVTQAYDKTENRDSRHYLVIQTAIVL